MHNSASVYVSSIGSEEVDDPLLDRLDAREEAAQTPTDILTPPRAWSERTGAR